MSAEVEIEVVFATADSQRLVALKLPQGSTVATAVRASKLGDDFPAHALTDCQLGIWGRLVAAEQTLVDGDRVEIYRELEVKPMEGRRLRALEPDPDPCEPR